jgi:hypothetical protein
VKVFFSLLFLSVSAFAFNPESLVREYTAERLESTGEKTAEARLPLPPLLNRYLKTRVEFKTPLGNTVYLSGGRSDGITYFSLTPDKGKVVLIDALTLIFAKQAVVVNGEKFLIDIDLNLLRQRSSKIQIYSETGKKSLLKQCVIDEIVFAAYDAGADLTIGGKSFKFTYGNKIVRSGRGLAFGAPKFVGFLHRDGDKIAAFTSVYEELLKGPVKLDVEADVLELRLEGDVLFVTGA